MSVDIDKTHIIDSESLPPEIREFAKEHFFLTKDPCESHCLKMVGEKLSYCHGKAAKFVSFDFLDYLSKFSSQRDVLKRGPLSKAIGMKGKSGFKVIDATCGSGKDSFLMLTWGAQVVAFERNPLIYALLLDSFLRLKRSGLHRELVDSFTLKFGSFTEEEGFEADVIYYDPMYPKHESDRKSALPRKEIQLFREIVGIDSDIKEVIKEVREMEIPKLVLKRSLHSKDDYGKASSSFMGKTTRYDLYVSVKKK